MASKEDPQRYARLSRLLNSYTRGDRIAKSAGDANLLLEAISVQEDPVGCVEHLVSSRNALAALKVSLRFDTTPQFLNGTLKDFIAILRVPAVEKACGGELLKQLLDIIVRPPTLWTALLTTHATGQLTVDGEICFAWLLLKLVAWTGTPPLVVDEVAINITKTKAFLRLDNDELRSLGYRIEHILQAKDSGLSQDEYAPGGRHSNDHANFRKISIFPSNDELINRQMPFYLPAAAITEKPFLQRPGTHLENQFRLLREDFLAQLREDLKVSTGAIKRRRPRTTFSGLSLQDIYCGDNIFKIPFALTLSVQRGLERLVQLNVNQRKAYLKNNPKFLKDQSFGCIMDQQRIIAFATLIRVESLLAQEHPSITLRMPDEVSLKKVLMNLKSSSTAEFIMVNTCVFAYEPILRCLQSTVELPLSQELFAVSEEEIEASVCQSDVAPLGLINEIETKGKGDLTSTLSSRENVNLDKSQLDSLLAGLRQSMSLIQGPPGTGKSFIGALLTKALMENTSEKILVLCYTNHALDQFLEDLLDTGIQASWMVRLGAKSTLRTESLRLSKQSFTGRRPWPLIKAKKEEAEEHETILRRLVSSLKHFKLNEQSLMEYLELSEDDSDFYFAFQVPERETGEQLVGRGGKLVDKYYLYDRWSDGQNAGIFSHSIPSAFPHIWGMTKDRRNAQIETWRQQLLQESISGIATLVEAYNKDDHVLREALNQKDCEIIKTKRIIACTTTAAAMYTKQLQNAAPGIVVVEEAGEILESHILTALPPQTKQLVLIGDHQQLRPKVNNHALTVEKGDGYDLNRSLFERLILAGFPHTTLVQQHRMCPEISSLVRQLTYPNLSDAPSTLSRSPLRGLLSRVVFIDHRNPELAASAVADRRDDASTVSKQNHWEVSMILKVVRYMAQQDYGTANQAVLTPYLGQLSLLHQELSKENDPILNDLDYFELIKAGLVSSASAAQKKRPLRMSTIDNFQGEESDVVIASLTRSNDKGDIGFMSSPERLNVLLSRARECLILIGDSDTFLGSGKGEAVWKPFLKILAERGQIYDGFPAQCQRHPDRKVDLKQPEDFDELCPDGGCLVPCGTKLRCGMHVCPQKCHALTDHSKMPCQHYVSGQCPKGHNTKWKCSKPLESCPTCNAEAKAEAARQRRDEQLDKDRKQKQADYAVRLAKIQAEIDHERRVMREQHEDEERQYSLRQQEKDLENARKQRAQLARQKEAAETTNTSQVTASLPLGNAANPTSPKIPTDFDNTDAVNGDVHEERVSWALDDWLTQKALYGERNDELDELMAMTGLENVKGEFLELKAKVDITVRQGISLAKERFNVSLLGNPGTGKTTVARLYGKYLASVGALPGDEFVETTGAKLANGGVKGCEKILDDIKTKGGGAFFIDEAYQLTSDSNLGGGAVVNYLLAEVENLTGKVVFILAGYNKNMEAFFAHNPGLPSRFPRQIQFADYQDPELLDIFCYRLIKKYGGRMEVEDGYKGLYTRIVARRLGRGRGKVGFGNARAVENALSKIESRQAQRVRQERRKGMTPGDLLLTKEDMVGPEPTNILKGNPAWKKLQQMIGLSSVKDSITALFDSIKYNFQRELEEKPIVDFSLNKVFLGSPGTGKTTVAKLYGQILADLGLLSTNKVVVKTPADFVGSVLGASEANTKAILDAAIGKVLVLDEAYGLYSASDPYKTAVIDTIVAEAQSVPGDDRCVLLLGYKQQMEDMMQNVNPGLARRFPINSGFLFEDFTDAEMAVILDAKLKSQGFSATDKGRSVAMEVLNRMRNRPNFGNAGQVDILLNDAKIRQQKRFARDNLRPSAVFEAEDFDPDYERADNASTNLQALFEGVVGCEGIVARMTDYQNVVANTRALGMDPRPELPFTFLFRGPPGTGKTTTARKMGQAYYDMGFLSTPEVVECSAKDLIGEYVGQTGPKAQKLIESALGKVLFVDEAYRLGEGSFAKEAVDELVDCITKTQFLNKVVIILAGYVDEINRLMDVNPGLSSRFAESIDFKPLNPQDCLKLLQSSLAKRWHIDISVLSNPSTSFEAQILEDLKKLSALANFANGRDVETLTKDIVGRVMKGDMSAKGNLVLSEELVLDRINVLISEREARAKSASSLATPIIDGRPLPLQTHTKVKDRLRASRATAGAMQQATERQTAVQEEVAQESDPAPKDDNNGSEHPPFPPNPTIRDANVSDATWAQLEQDILAAEAEERECERLAKAEAELKDFLQACADAKRQRELEELEQRRREMESKLQREAEEKKQLGMIGRCPIGYSWIRQIGGYRCAGGSHWVPDREIGGLMGR